MLLYRLKKKYSKALPTMLKIMLVVKGK